MTFAPGDTPSPEQESLWKRLLIQHTSWLVGIFVVLVFAWNSPSWVARLDLLAYDLLIPQRNPSSEPAIVVAIDDESLATIGRWPWPRSIHAALIEQLRAAGASVIGIAVMFNESDSEDGVGDAALAAAIKRHGSVVLPLVPAQQADGGIVEGIPTPALRISAAQLGHVDAEVDLDGLVRRLYLRAGRGQPSHSAFALAALDLLKPPAADTSLPGLRRGALDRSPLSSARWTRDNEVLLPRTPGQPKISFARALHSPELLAQVRGHVVFVGITAAGLGGELATPVSGTQSLMPAVEFHANAFEALRSQSLIEPAAQNTRLVFALMMVCLLLVLPLRGRQYQVLAGGAMVCLPLLICAVILHTSRVWLFPITPTLGLLVGYGVWLGLDLRSARTRLTRIRRHSLATLEAIGDGVISVDRAATIRYSNPVAQLQMNGAGSIGSRLASALPLASDSMLLLRAAVDECLRTANEIRLSPDLRLLTADGSSRSLRASVSPLRGSDRGLDGAVIVLADFTEAVASANRLQHAATHDGLTNLPNRVLLHERLNLALARMQRRGSTMAILFLDLDRFKRINDSLGHRQGDEVLKVMAERLKAICRSTDFVARWGGDEFVVLMEDVSGPEAVAIAAAKLVSSLRDDIETHGVRLSTSCSVGVVMAPQDGVEVDSLLAKADAAMYRAKSHPDAGFHFYSSELKIWTQERLAIEMDLRHVLRDKQFELHYQPQYELRNHALVGFEALLRWRRTPDQLVQPDQFIGVAEETGLIVEIGAWVVLQAAKDLASMLAAGHPAVPVAVNVSARQCVNRNIVEVVRNALQQTGIQPALLKLEITETTAMTDAAQVVELLEEISALGVRIVVDDFGTGYSSLAYLKRFPIDELKIDRSFVRDVASDSDDAAIVRATIALAHELGILVVAEGVETEQQSIFLAGQNCDIAQGFLYGRPKPGLREA